MINTRSVRNHDYRYTSRALSCIPLIAFLSDYDTKVSSPYFAQFPFVLHSMDKYVFNRKFPHTRLHSAGYGGIPYKT